MVKLYPSEIRLYNLATCATVSLRSSLRKTRTTPKELESLKPLLFLGHDLNGNMVSYSFWSRRVVQPGPVIQLLKL
jgi:hypothetical protein